MAIKSFRDRETRRLDAGEFVSDFQSFEQQARKRLRYLDSATTLRNLADIPSNRLERLRGDRDGQYSIRINRQWRICFRWLNNDAYDVGIVDYH